MKLIYRILTILTVLIFILTLIYLNNLYGFIICILLIAILYSLHRNKLFDKSIIDYISRKKVLTLMILGIASLIIFIFHQFKLSYNIEFLFNHKGEILIKENQVYKPISNLYDSIDLNIEYKNNDITIYSVECRREKESFFHRIDNFFQPNRIFIFEFCTNNRFSLYADIKSGFKLLNSSEAITNSEANFSLNTNFYGSKNEVQGELIINGINYGDDEIKKSGFFKVIDGKPYVGARSLFNNLKGEIQYSCQAYPSVIA